MLLIGDCLFCSKKNSKLKLYSSTVSSILNEFTILKQLSEGGVYVLDTVSSTNQYLIDNIKHIQLGTVIVTENQTQGRGRGEKIWITPKGQSICLSMYWRLRQKLLNTMEFSVTISCVLATVLKKLGVLNIQIKWPNDLYVYNRKLAGILIEIIKKNHYVSHLIIGIGINISISRHTQLEIKSSKNWIDLNDLGCFLNRNILVAILVKKLRKTLIQIESIHN